MPKLKRKNSAIRTEIRKNYVDPGLLKRNPLTKVEKSLLKGGTSGIRDNLELINNIINNPRKRDRGRPRKNPPGISHAPASFIQRDHLQSILNNPMSNSSLNRLEKDIDKIKEKVYRAQFNSNPVAHFPKTSRGRPSKKKRGRPRIAKHTGSAAFFQEYQKKKRKSHKGRPTVNGYWIADAYVNNKLYATYIGKGTKNNATIEAKNLIGYKLGSKIIDKVMLSGPYPFEDGKPDSSWPRL